MADQAGIEPALSAVTGQRFSRLSYWSKMAQSRGVDPHPCGTSGFQDRAQSRLSLLCMARKEGLEPPDRLLGDQLFSRELRSPTPALPHNNGADDMT